MRAASIANASCWSWKRPSQTKPCAYGDAFRQPAAGQLPVRPFEAVVQDHGPRVLRVCRAITGPDDAEDAWSETFISALRAYPELPEDANVEAWLVTIAHRRSIDLVRCRSRQPLPVGDPGKTAERNGAEEPNDAEVAHTHDDLYAAMRDLPSKQRLAVAYHHLGGLPHREVAELLGGSEAAVRRACADGIAALRKTHFWEDLS
ncbi:RNA polymerase sigma factor [Ornithinimicrobium sp. Arc0846-15]|nr:RNA polymerase sigma factor [Ornithinimicrobium laminariae]